MIDTKPVFDSANDAISKSADANTAEGKLVALRQAAVDAIKAFNAMLEQFRALRQAALDSLTAAGSAAHGVVAAHADDELLAPIPDPDAPASSPADASMQLTPPPATK
jgi:hypothetical protein